MRIIVKKLTLIAVLTAVALIVHVIEAQIPLPIPIPGAKLGIANTVTLFALFYGKQGNRYNVSLKAADAFMILICRIILGAMFTVSGIAFIYSLSGGMLGFAAQAALKRIVTNEQIWVCGAAGAMFHNIGQIIAAIFVTGTPSIAAYLPMLIIAGIITGIITGLAAQFTLKRI